MRNRQLVRTPAWDDRTEDSGLSQRLKDELIYAHRLKTFGAIARRHLSDLFKKLYRYISPDELLALNAELSKRSMSEIWPEYALKPGPGGLPSAVVARLWEHRRESAMSLLGISRSYLSEIVTEEHISVVCGYLKNTYGFDLTIYIAWHTTQGFPEKSLSRLGRLKMWRVSDLFSAEGERLYTEFSKRLATDSAVKRDNYRTIAYARWWFAKKFPEFSKK